MAACLRARAGKRDAFKRGLARLCAADRLRVVGAILSFRRLILEKEIPIISFSFNMRLVSCLTVLIIFFAPLSTARVEEINATHARTIEVCVLIDKESPVKAEVISQAINSVSREYENHVRIRFKAHTFVPFKGNVGILPVDFSRFVKHVCAPSNEVRIVITNEAMEFPRPDGRIEELLAYADDYAGVIIMYNVEKQSRDRDQGGNPALETSLKHEIGHLFGLEHTTDLESFLHFTSNSSLGRWTIEVKRLIKENKWRRWL